MTAFRSALAAPALALAMVCVAAPSRAQEPMGRPDFTGVWRMASPPMTRLGVYPDLSFTAEAWEKIEAYRELVEPGGETPGMHCVGHGMPQMMMGGGDYPIEVIQKPDQVTIISEFMSQTRRFYLGDRIVPDAEIFPSRQGYSKAHWEGETLVVETTHLQEMVDSDYPHSADAVITERFSLTEDADGTPRLVADTVIDDPAWMTEPLEYRLEWAPYEIGWIMPYECMEPDWFDHLEALADADE